MKLQRNLKHRFSPFAAIILVVVASSTAGAVNLNAIPSLSLEERYDSNIFNTSANEQSDYVFRATPRLTLSVEGFGTSVKLGGGFDLEKYSDHTELDQNTASKNFDLTTAEPLSITPRFRLRPSARFVETRDSYRRNVLTMAPEPDLPPSETVVTQRTNVREISGSMQTTYLLTPRLDLGIGGGGTRREFTEGAPGLIDSRTLTGNASISYRVTPRFSPGLFFDTSYNSFGGRPNSRTYSSGLSGNYVLTEHYTLGARAGASYLSESTGVGDQRNTSWSPNGRLSFTYQWEAFRATILGSYDLAGAGSTGTTTKRGNVVLTLSDQFTQAWGWDLSASFQSNKSADSSRNEDVDSSSASAGIRYQAARWATFRLSGNAFRQRNHGISIVTDVDRNTVLLGLTLSDTYNLF